MMSPSSEVKDEEKDILTDAAITDKFTYFIKLHQPHFTQVESIVFSEHPVFVLDFNSLVAMPDTELLCDLLHKEADRALSCLKDAVKATIHEIDPDSVPATAETDIQIQIKNWDEKRSLRDINASLEGKLIAFDCIVTRSSEKKPFLFSSVYVCRGCSQLFPTVKNEMLKKCPSCEDKLLLSKKKSKFTDTRVIHVQELPEDLPAGHLPSKNVIRVFGNELTRSDRCRPGTRITVTAIIRFDYDSNTMSDLKTHDPLGLVENFGISLKLVLDANNIQKKEIDNSLYGGLAPTLTEAELERISKLQKNLPLLEETLINSFAPHIYSHQVLKEAILLLLVGATPGGGHSSCLSYNEGATITTPTTTTQIIIPTRGDMHMLLVGNPGIAKSKLLEFAALISPRCIKTTGRGSTAAGLTAAVVKDEGGVMMLEAGAVVLGDLGLTVIDEFDKLRSEDRSALHEAMEQQTVSISKGGIIATLNSRTSILAAANPIYGAYDLFKSISENTELPSSLLSRFDLVFALPDIVDETRDRNIAKAMLSQHKKKTNSSFSNNNTTTKDKQQENIFPIEFLAKYLHYAKNVHTSIPPITPGAEKLIEDQYIHLRRFAERDANFNTAKTITVTPRVVDALYRLSVARARLLLKDQVDERDVQRAIFLIEAMYKSFGIDIEAGNSNLTLLYGAPLAKKNKLSVFLDVCNSVSGGGENDIGHTNLINDLIKTGRFSDMDARQMIRKASDEGILEHRRGNVYYFNKDALSSDRSTNTNGR